MAPPAGVYRVLLLLLMAGLFNKACQVQISQFSVSVQRARASPSRCLRAAIQSISTSLPSITEFFLVFFIRQTSRQQTRGGPRLFFFFFFFSFGSVLLNFSVFASALPAPPAFSSAVAFGRRDSDWLRVLLRSSRRRVLFYFPFLEHGFVVVVVVVTLVPFFLLHAIPEVSDCSDFDRAPLCPS